MMNINQAIKTLEKLNDRLYLSANHDQASIIAQEPFINWIEIPVNLKSDLTFECHLPPLITKIAEVIDLEQTQLSLSQTQEQFNQLKIQWQTGEFNLDLSPEKPFDLPLEHWSNYPDLSLDQNLLKLIFTAHQFSDTGYDPTRPQLSGVNLNINHDQATVTATNTHFLYTDSIPFTHTTTANITLYPQTIKLLKKLKITGQLYLGQDYIKIVSAEGIKIIAKIYTDYVDLTKVNPPQETALTLNRQELIKKIAPLGQTQNHSLLLISENSTIKIKGFVYQRYQNNQEIGETSLEATVLKQATFKVNSHYFLKIIRSIKTPLIQIATNQQIIRINHHFILALEEIK